jgi:hypothetical protein
MWRRKAHTIIESLAWQSYQQTNYDRSGRKYKKHRPYRLPMVAEVLVECLNTNDEIRAKVLFATYGYRQIDGFLVADLVTVRDVQRQLGRKLSS